MQNERKKMIEKPKKKKTTRNKQTIITDKKPHFETLN